jgi:AcrR family transcriptional regulator
MSANDDGGLRERKKIATREALSVAALRLAMEHGPENVRVDEIAEAAGVSPRTYNNYFSSREQAIVSAIEAERALRVAAALRARPAGEPLADAVVEAVVGQYVAEGEPGSDAFALLVSASGLRAEFLRTVAGLERPLATAIADRIGAGRQDGGDEGRDGGGEQDIGAAVLAAAVSAAARVAAERWLRPAADSPLVVVPQGSLADVLRQALAHVVPALRAADPRPQ